MKKNNKSLSHKVILALLLGCSAIFLSWIITKTTFRRVLTAVHQLSTPNEKLQLVNTLFRNVVQMDQLQRLQTLQPNTESPYQFLKASNNIVLMLDSLAYMSRNNASQTQRIDSMKRIIRERDKIFISYLHLRSDFIKNDTLNAQIESLSQLIDRNLQRHDSSVVTTEHKITTTTIEGGADSIAEKATFWDKLLGRKKDKGTTQAKRLIQEELNIKIDTLAFAKEDSITQKLSKAVAIAEANRNSNRDVLIKRQAQLNKSGNVLISQLLTILQDLEKEELQHAAANNSDATTLVSNGVERINLILILFIAGLALLAFLIFDDIGKSNRYRKELILAKEEAEQLGQVKQRFLANMSHELRTPLQAIVGMSEQMKMNQVARPKDINILYQSSQHLLQTVNEVLDYSRIISDKFTMDNKVFDMKQLLDEVIELIKFKASEKELGFVYQTYIDAPSEYIGDPFRLKQILYNLLGNAIKFTEHGSLSLIVTQKESSTGTAFTFTIKDTGIGITEADISRIFNQFEQGNTSSYHNHQGTGLGLSIVKSLVDTHKGILTVDSTPGEGSAFAVTLSYTRANATPANVQTDAVKWNKKDLNIWIVDDDNYILQICDIILQKHGIPHSCFSSAESALQAIPDNTVNTVLLDIRMPGIDGFTLCQRLRDQFADQPVKYVALTAQAMADEKQKLQAHFDDLLIKPFMEKDLLHVLELNDSAIKPTHTQTGNKLWQLDNLTYGDNELTNKILHTFTIETTNDIALLRQSIDAAEPVIAAEYIHKLAGRCGQLGAKEFALRLRKIEVDLRKMHNWLAMKETLRHVCEETDEMIANVNAELSN